MLWLLEVFQFGAGDHLLCHFISLIWMTSWPAISIMCLPSYPNPTFNSLSIVDDFQESFLFSYSQTTESCQRPSRKHAEWVSGGFLQSQLKPGRTMNKKKSFLNAYLFLPPSNLPQSLCTYLLLKTPWRIFPTLKTFSKGPWKQWQNFTTYLIFYSKVLLLDEAKPLEEIVQGIYKS